MLPYDNLPRRSPPPRSADCPIRPPPAPGCFFGWWSHLPVGHHYCQPTAQTVPSPFKYTVCAPPRRSPPPRSADCPIRPPPAPGCFYSWWSRPPVGHHYCHPPPRPCRPLQIHRVPFTWRRSHHPAQRIARSVHHLHRVGSLGRSRPPVGRHNYNPPPRPCRPFQIHRVISTCGNPHHPAQRIARSVHHLHRVASLSGGPVPQLAISIIHPQPRPCRPPSNTPCD